MLKYLVNFPKTPHGNTQIQDHKTFTYSILKFETWRHRLYKKIKWAVFSNNEAKISRLHSKCK